MENISQFVVRLKQSQIASPEVIELWLDRVANKSSTSEFVKFLLTNEHLTRWQAKFLLSAKHKMKFGNYLLLNLVKSNSIGDWFLARHSKLNQKVRIFFLNETLSQKLQQRQEVLRLAASASDINHPNLLHLHTIEFDSGRFLIVTDEFDSPSLDNPDRLTQLTKEDIPNIVLQLVEAGAVAHSKGLSHGTITDSDVLYSVDGKLKLQNAVSSFLVHNLNDEYTGPTNRMEEDIKAIEKISKRLLRRFSDSLPEKGKLNSILTKLGSQKKSLWQTSDALRSLYGSAPRKSPKPDSASNPGDVTHANATTNTHAAPTTANSPQQNPSQGQSKEQENEQPELKTGAPVRWLNWALPAMSALLLAIVGIVLAWQFRADQDFGTVATISTAKSSDTGDLPTLDKPKKKKAKSAGKKKTKPVNLETEKTNDQPNADLPASKPIDEEEPEPIKEKSVTEKQDKNSQAKENDSSKPAQDTSPDSILSSFNSISSAKNQPKETAKNNEDSATSGKSDVPNSVDLGLPSNNMQIHIATFANPFVDLQLATSPDVGPGKIQYELNGDSKMGWQIMMQSQSIPKSEIAKLKMYERDLKFTWTADSDLADKCGYLINCLFRTNSGGESHTIALRKPVSIDGFKLDGNEPKLKLEINNIPYPPENPISALDELDRKKYGNTYTNNDLDDRTFNRKNPLELHFRDLIEYQMLFLRLKSDLKKKWRLEAEMFLALAPGQKPVLASGKTLEPAKAYLENQVATAEQGLEYLDRPIDSIRKERGLTKDQYPDKLRKAQKKELKKQLELFEERSREYSKILGQAAPLFDAPIPITIYFEIDGERVVLASTELE